MNRDTKSPIMETSPLDDRGWLMLIKKIVYDKGQIYDKLAKIKEAIIEAKI